MWRFMLVGGASLLISMAIFAIFGRGLPAPVSAALAIVFLIAMTAFVVMAMTWNFRLFSSGRRMMRDNGDEKPR